MNRAAVVLVAVVLAGLPETSDAQVVGPLLPAGRLEVGAMWRRTDRTLEDNGRTTAFSGDQEVATARYGVTGTATFSVELSTGIAGGEDDSEMYTVGGGLQTVVWTQRDFRLTTGFHYARTLAIAREANIADVDEQRIEWNLVAEFPLHFSDNVLTLWLGPALNHLTVVFQAPYPEDSFEPTGIMGAVLGTNFVFVDHLVVQAHALWVDEFQPRVFLAYRF
jgi:hypothetical protein